MKIHPSSRRPTGFTLVELLVVITIIVVLASLGFVGATAAIDKAKKTTALNTATSLEQAINRYFDEYGALPIPEAGTMPISTTSVAGQELLATLTGEDETTNPKKIQFFTAKETENDRDGMSYVGSTPEALFDPWGQPYYVSMDDDYDQVIEVNIPKANISPTNGGTIRGRSVVVYSLGKDFEESSIMPKDMALTWR